jgi:hypothetical protein
VSKFAQRALGDMSGCSVVGELRAAASHGHTVTAILAFALTQTLRAVIRRPRASGLDMFVDDNVVSYDRDECLVSYGRQARLAMLSELHHVIERFEDRLPASRLAPVDVTSDDAT